MAKEKNEVITVDAQAIPAELKMNNKEALALRTEVILHRDQIESHYYKLGACLKRVHTNALTDGVPLWKAWGFASFDEYCERELGFRERKAYYLLDVFDSVANGPMSEEDVEGLGWTKAATLAPLVKKGIINNNNVEEWMAKSNSKTHNELREMAVTARTVAAKVGSDARALASSKGGATKEDVDKAVSEAIGKIKVEEVTIAMKAPDVIHMFRVGLHEEQWKVWQNALQKAKEITGSDKEPWLVECIGTAFLAECLNGREDMLQVLLNRIEEAYGVKTFAVNHSGEVQHCHPDIANLAEKIG